MSILKTTLAIIFTLVAILVLSSVFTVREGQQALLLRFGKMDTNPKTGKIEIFGPGLHFKKPFIEHARLFDARIQTADVQSDRIVTAEKKHVLVDYYVKWRINNFPIFYTRTGGNYQQASNLLQQQLNDSLRALFGKRTIQEVVAEDRVKIMVSLLGQANSSAKNLGIDVIDVRIKKIDLPETVTNTVYQQMRAERERVATGHRSQGKADAEAIEAQADANVTVVIANAKAQAAKIRAQGDALAAETYNDAYSKDAEFYAFYRSMLAYQHSFDTKKDILVLKPDSQFFRYFNNDSGKQQTESKKQH